MFNRFLIYARQSDCCKAMFNRFLIYAQQEQLLFSVLIKSHIACRLVLKLWNCCNISWDLIYNRLHELKKGVHRHALIKKHADLRKCESCTHLLFSLLSPIFDQHASVFHFLVNALMPFCIHHYRMCFIYEFARCS